MTDTPSVEDIVSAEIDKTETAPLEVKESKETPEETVKPEVQEAEQQPEENFTTFNPNDLTPEMQAVYKRWQGDYTRTRQTEKAHIKELEEKLAQFEKQAMPSQTEIDNSYQAGIQNGQIDPKMTLADYTQMVKEQTKNEIKAEIKTDQENSYIETQEREFFNLDPRFSEGPGQDKVLLNYVAGELGAMRDAYEAEHDGNVLGFDFVGNAKELIAKYDERVIQSNKAFVAKQSEQAKANASQSAKAMPRTSNSSGKPSGKVSFDDAFDTAWTKTVAN